MTRFPYDVKKMQALDKIIKVSISRFPKHILLFSQSVKTRKGRIFEHSNESLAISRENMKKDNPSSAQILHIAPLDGTLNARIQPPPFQKIIFEARHIEKVSKSK